MAGEELYGEASNVTAKHGDVVVKGPDSVDVKMTPEAAEETADKLIKGAMEAQGQRHFDGVRK